MKSKSIISFMFASSILATTMGVAHSTELRSRAGLRYAHHYATARLALHHYGRVHREAAWQHGTTHQRYGGYSIALGTHRDMPAQDHASIGTDLFSGIASVYSGGHTASGEFASAGGLTAAHRTLPFGTMVQVTNRSTGRPIVVRIK